VVGACGGAALATGVWSQGLLQLVRQQLRGTITAQNPPTTLRDPDAPGELPQAATITDLVMPQRTFQDFSTALEQVHDQVHVWVGGAMGQVPTAGYDPIFYSHHAMIDRLWYLWQLSPNGTPPPEQLLDVILMPFPMTVRQTLDISILGYDYAVGVIA
jgi:tyrosinase